jgi:putative colanic acid biosynthesis UDP-glucose lipid carrier transferase
MQLSRKALVRIQPNRADPIGFLKQLLDPLMAVGVLFLIYLLFKIEIRSIDGILAALAFSLGWPGQIPFRRVQPGLLREVILRWVTTVALLTLVGLVTRTTGNFEPQVLHAWFIATPLLQYGLHRLSPFIVARSPLGGRQASCVIVGAGPLGRELARAISRDPFEIVRIAAYFDDRNNERLGCEDEEDGTVTPLGRLSDVARYVQVHQIQRIYIALPMASQPRILALLDALRDTTASIYFAPDIFVHDLIQARVETIGGMPVVAVCESPFFGTEAFVKRLSDIGLAVIAIALTTPIMLGVAIAVATTSPGPILFRQRRYGLDGREIEVWKFRSMRTQDDGAVIRQATREDARITNVGRWIRKTSLDELPQFFNVLQGRMSVVGPRPHAVAHNEMFRSLIKGYMVRHKVKPGITGWAQVNGARGETATVDAMSRRIDLDLAYLRNWSLNLDLRILWGTVRLMVRDPNAY